MKPSQAFGVAVRVFGLLAWVASSFYFLSAVIVFLSPNFRAGAAPWWHYLISTSIYFVAGLLLLRKADAIVGFAYRRGDIDAPDV